MNAVANPERSARPLVVGLVLAVWLLALAAHGQQGSGPTNGVLELDGYGDYVELPAGIYDDLTAATFEAWVRWDEFGYYSQWFHYGTFGFNNFAETSRLQLFMYDAQEAARLHNAWVGTTLPTGTWHHVAAVCGPDGLRHYLNGVLVARDDYTGCFDQVAGTGAFEFGRSPWVENRFFEGRLDEIRVWSYERSEDQLRESLHRPVDATTPGLVGYWTFDDGDARDSSPGGHHGVLHGDAIVVRAHRPTAEQVEPVRLLTGQVFDESGAVPAGAVVEVWEQDHLRLAEPVADDGSFRIALYGRRPVLLRVTADDAGTWLPLPAIRRGESRLRLPITLPAANRVAGIVRSLDGDPAQGATVDLLRAQGDRFVMAERTFTNRAGQYRFTNHRPGTYRLRCHTAEGTLLHGGSTPTSFDLSPGRQVAADFDIVHRRLGVVRTHDPRGGLAVTSVEEALQRRDGSVWLGTTEGLWSFDGEAFEQLTTADGLIHNGVLALFEDADSTLWIATEGGVSRRKAGRFLPVDCDPLDGRVVTDILRDRRGDLWFASRYHGVWRFDAACDDSLSMRRGLASDRVRHLMEAHDGTLWIGTDAGVSLWDGSSLSRLDTKGLPSQRVEHLYETRDGTVWVLTGAGPARVDAMGTHPLVMPNPQLMAAAVEDDDGTMWFGTSTALLRLKDGVLTSYPEVNGHTLRGIGDLTVSDDGMLWIASRYGLSLRMPDAVTLYAASEGLRGTSTTALMKDADALLVGSDVGVDRFDGIRFRALEGLGSPSVRALKRDADGSLWIGTDVGARRLRRGELTNTTITGYSNAIQAIALDNDGRPWLGSNQGLFRYVGTEALRVPLPSELYYDVRALLPSRYGGMWVGLVTFGLFHADGETSVRYDLPSGFSNGVALAAGKDDLWIGTQGGVLQVPLPAGGLPDSLRVRRHVNHDGVILSNVSDLVFGDGRLYCSTLTGGVALYDGTTWSSLDEGDGLLSREAGALLLDETGSLWIGSGPGLVRYRRTDTRPRVRITSVRTDTLWQRQREVPVELGTRASFEYRAIDFVSQPSKRRYRTRILRERTSADSGWTSASRQTRFEWRPSAAGSWLFQVQAIDRDLNYSEPATVQLHVFLPWYRNAWVTSPLGLLLAALVCGLTWRVRRQRLESDRLRQQVLDQERSARQSLEESNRHLSRARREAEQASELKSRFLANVSHEIRTPLNAILGYAQILRGRTDVDPQIRQGLDTIKTSGDHLLALIGDVLDLSKVEAGEQQLEVSSFDLVRVVEDVAAMFALSCERKGLRWTVTWSPGIPSSHAVSGDEGKLRQVLINLLSNAVKYTDRGSVQLALDLQDEGVHFAVVDTGPGLDDSQQVAVFEPFQRGEGHSRTAGTGLGLAIARAHVRLMGGELRLESELGTGSRFHFDIPLPSSPSGVLTVDDFADVSRLKTEMSVRALVADDLPENRRVLREILERVGVEVTEAADGEAAVAMALASPFRVLFLDMRMPVLDGGSALRRIHDALGEARPPAIVVSASVLEQERQAYLEAGFDGFVPKPVRQEAVYRVLADLLHLEFDRTVEKATVAATGDVPTDTIERLRADARAGRLTHLTKGLADLRSTGHGELAERLEERARAIDMDGLVAILDEVAATSRKEGM